jgi:hypothetical protein
MRIPNGYKPEDIMKNGIFYRNPSHLKEAEQAVNQLDIVEAINERHQKRAHEVILFDDPDKITFPGMTKIREMEEEDLQKFFLMLLKSRPTLFMVRISLGAYPTQKPVTGGKVNQLNINRATELPVIAERLADLFSDSRVNITDLVITFTSSGIGTPFIQTHAWGVGSKEERDTDEYFEPVIELEYMKK